MMKKTFLERSREFRQHLVVANIEENVLDVFVDLETTGLETLRDEILQIGGMTKDREYFNVYVMPSGDISKEITQLTKIDVRIIDDVRILHVDGRPVEAMNLPEATNKFVEFLESTGKKINLVGHNVTEFDYRFLYYALRKTNTFSRFESVVYSLADSLHASRDGLKERSNRQAALIRKYLPGFQYREHDALEDVGALATLLEKIKDKINLGSCTYTLDSVTTAVRVSFNLP